MSATCPPRHPALRALVLLALFALGLVMQPLASALGELHGALAHGEGLSSHANHIDDGHDNADADHDDGGMAHALLHVAHCCGHAQAMPSTEPASLGAPFSPMPFPMLDAAPASPLLRAELRPPIRA